LHKGHPHKPQDKNPHSHGHNGSAKYTYFIIGLQDEETNNNYQNTNNEKSHDIQFWIESKGRT
jgi:hypothetical protein